MTYQQQVSRPGSVVVDHADGEWRERLRVCASTCCNKDNKDVPLCVTL